MRNGFEKYSYRMGNSFGRCPCAAVVCLSLSEQLTSGMTRLASRDFSSGSRGTR